MTSKKSIIIFLLFFTFACSKTEVSKIKYNSDGKYFLSFDITCYDNTSKIYTPKYCKVCVFDAKTKEKKESDYNSQINGHFDGQVKYSLTDEIRIEFYNSANACVAKFGCINGGEGLTPINTSSIYRLENEPFNINVYHTGQGLFHKGSCSDTNIITDDVWGP